MPVYGRPRPLWHGIARCGMASPVALPVSSLPIEASLPVAASAVVLHHRPWHCQLGHHGPGAALLFQFGNAIVSSFASILSACIICLQNDTKNHYYICLKLDNAQKQDLK